MKTIAYLVGEDKQKGAPGEWGAGATTVAGSSGCQARAAAEAPQRERAGDAEEDQAGLLADLLRRRVQRGHERAGRVGVTDGGSTLLLRGQACTGREPLAEHQVHQEELQTVGHGTSPG